MDASIYITHLSCMLMHGQHHSSFHLHSEKVYGGFSTHSEGKGLVLVYSEHNQVPEFGEQSTMNQSPSPFLDPDKFSNLH